MSVILLVLLVIVLAGGLFSLRRRFNHAKVVRYSISPEELHANLAEHPDTLVYDVRLPLDLLANPAIIPDARRVPPSDLIANPTLIPRDKDVIVYCTCPGDETSRMIINKARKLQFSRVKFLRGGLDAWKALGYPVVPYDEAFHLDTNTALPRL